MGSRRYPSVWRGIASLLIFRLASVFDQSTGVDASTSSSYLSCTGTPTFIGDGDCDDINNNAACGYDGGDCCSCTCEDGSFYTCGPLYDCQDPGAWCLTTTPTPAPTTSLSSTLTEGSTPTCTSIFVGDGECDSWNNDAECDYDGGDCCECTCEDGPTYSCEAFDCQDPDAWCSTATPTPTPTPTTSPSPSPTESPTQAFTSNFVGDGECDSWNNDAVCDYDGGDCCECTCEDGPIYSCGEAFDCQDPDAWCSSSNPSPATSPTESPAPTCTGRPEYAGDGECDDYNNNEACDYDGGDCCECTCEDGPFFDCGPSFDSCDDPLANCSVSTSGISTVVIACICVAGALFIGFIGILVGRRHIRRRDGGAAGGDRTPAAGGAQSSLPQHIPDGGTGGASVRPGGQLNTVRDPPLAFYDANTHVVTAVPLPFQHTRGGEQGIKTGAVTSNTPPPPFEEATTGQVGDAGVEAIYLAESTANVPDGVLVPPSYEKVMSGP